MTQVDMWDSAEQGLWEGGSLQRHSMLSTMQSKTGWVVRKCKMHSSNEKLQAEGTALIISALRDGKVVELQ